LKFSPWEFSSMPWFNRSWTEKPLFGFHLYCTTASTLYEPGPGANLFEQSELIALQNVYIVWRQVRCLNLLDNMSLLSFRWSQAIASWFDEFGESRYDAEWLRFLASPTDNSRPGLDWTLFILNQ
jgi:hypothetical protein